MHDWQYFFNHDRSNLNQGFYRIFEPEWKAEILHWFSREDVDKEQKEDFSKVLVALKNCLSKQFYKNSSYRYEAVFKIIWHCAEKMNYPDFYKLWLAKST